MTGYIIGVILGVIVFLLQNFKPTSFGFRIMFLLTSIALFVGMYFTNLGYWNIFIIPIGEIILAFISAVFFPYWGHAALNEYKSINGENYFINLHDKDKIGRIQVAGFKQTYDRIIAGIISQIVTNQQELELLGNLIYSKNFYPISTHTKEEILQHINNCIEKTANSSRQGNTIKINADNNIEHLFNAYVSVMSIHEEATRNIEELKKTY